MRKSQKTLGKRQLSLFLWLRCGRERRPAYQGCWGSAPPRPCRPSPLRTQPRRLSLPDNAVSFKIRLTIKMVRSECWLSRHLLHEVLHGPVEVARGEKSLAVEELQVEPVVPPPVVQPHPGHLPPAQPAAGTPHTSQLSSLHYCRLPASLPLNSLFNKVRCWCSLTSW